MAAFPAREREAFMAHWTKILADHSNTIQTILLDGAVVGNIVSWEQSGRTLVGYWVGKEYWGKGVATVALSQFLVLVKARPLHAYVAKHNMASIRVLQKCGFMPTTEDIAPSSTNQDEVEEVLLKLEVSVP
jgi:RimJ/RimL family protein N-acetyltransferase